MFTELTILTTTILTVTCEKTTLEAISTDKTELTMPTRMQPEVTAKPVVPSVTQSYKQNPDIPCGLPPFADKMPKKQAEELVKAWKNYKQGKDCGLHQAKTFEIINSLSNEERARLFGLSTPAPPASPAPEPAVSIVPMFIRTSPPQTRQLFDAILANETMAEAEKFATMEKIAPKLLSPGQLADFKLWIGSLKAQKEQLDARIDALSDEASEALRQITELRLKEREIIKALAPQVLFELNGLI